MSAIGGHGAAGQPAPEDRGISLMREIRLSQTLDWSTTAVLEASTQGKPYDLEDFAAAISHRVDVKDITSIVSTNRNNVVLVSFKSSQKMQHSVTTSEIIVKGFNANIYSANPTRVMWVTLSGVPHQISNNTVGELLISFGRIVTTKSIFMTGRFAHILTGTRKILLEVKAGVTPEDIPYELQVRGHNVIVNIAGRRLKCLKCNGFGHKRKDCDVPKCTKCRKYGHAEDTCTGVRTYASVVEGPEFPPLPGLTRKDVPPSTSGGTVGVVTVPLQSAMGVSLEAVIKPAPLTETKQVPAAKSPAILPRMSNTHVPSPALTPGATDGLGAKTGLAHPTVIPATVGIGSAAVPPVLSSSTEVSPTPHVVTVPSNTVTRMVTDVLQPAQITTIGKSDVTAHKSSWADDVPEEMILSDTDYYTDDAYDITADRQAALEARKSKSPRTRITRSNTAKTPYPKINPPDVPPPALIRGEITLAPPPAMTDASAGTDS